MKYGKKQKTTLFWDLQRAILLLTEYKQDIKTLLLSRIEFKYF